MMIIALSILISGLLLQQNPFLTPFRNAVMFNNEHMADVHFIVGLPGATQKVPAHKVCLKSFKDLKRNLQVSFGFIDW